MTIDNIMTGIKKEGIPESLFKQKLEVPGLKNYLQQMTCIVK